MNLLYLIVLLVFSPIIYSEESIYFNTVDYPPYFSESLPGGGAATVYINDYLMTKKMKLKIRHVTYLRQLDLLKSKKELISFVTVFNEEEKPKVDGFKVTDSVGKYYFCLMSKGKVTSGKFEDNKHLKFLVAKGFTFHKLLMKHGIEYNYSTTDIMTSLRRLLKDRVDVIFTTDSLFKYLKATVADIGELTCKKTKLFGVTYLVISNDLAMKFDVESYNKYIREKNYWEFEKKYLDDLKESERKRRASLQIN